MTLFDKITEKIEAKQELGDLSILEKKVGNIYVPTFTNPYQPAIIVISPNTILDFKGLRLFLFNICNYINEGQPDYQMIEKAPKLDFDSDSCYAAYKEVIGQRIINYSEAYDLLVDAEILDPQLEGRLNRRYSTTQNVERQITIMAFPSPIDYFRNRNQIKVLDVL